MGSGNTESLNYAGNDGTCDHSRLMMLLGNAPQVGTQMSGLDLFTQRIFIFGCVRAPLMGTLV